MSYKHAPNTERAAETKRLIGELQDFSEELPQHERTFVQDMSEKIDKWGENTFVSDKQFNWLCAIYERVIG